jgi:hypothetical protein
VDKTGPATGGVKVAPNPNNGTLPFNQAMSAVRVSVTSSNPSSGGPKLSPMETSDSGGRGEVHDHAARSAVAGAPP